MMYYTLTVKDNDYKLRLSAKACVDLEKKLGRNPVAVIADMATSQTIPGLDVILTIVQGSMSQFNHGIDMNKMYEIYDDYVDEGHTMFDLIAVIGEVFKVSGLLPDEAEPEKN